MSRQPSYPQDAAVGDEASGAGKESGNRDGGNGDGGNRDGGGEDGGSGAPDGARRTKHLVTGAAIGIGSAAIVAALLYAKKRKSDR
jgi:hypothetical protein